MEAVAYFPEVSIVVPDYNTKAFTVYFKDEPNEPMALDFQNYLMWIMIKDHSLTDYMVKHHKKSSFNDMVEDLYQLGYPVESKVSELFADMEKKTDPALLKLLHFLRNGFSNPQDEDLEG